jgi:hypothetical protein
MVSVQKTALHRAGGRGNSFGRASYKFDSFAHWMQNRARSILSRPARRNEVQCKDSAQKWAKFDRTGRGQKLRHHGTQTTTARPATGCRIGQGAFRDRPHEPPRSGRCSYVGKNPTAPVVGKSFGTMRPGRQLGVSLDAESHREHFKTARTKQRGHVSVQIPRKQAPSTSWAKELSRWAARARSSFALWMEKRTGSILRRPTQPPRCTCPTTTNKTNFSPSASATRHMSGRQIHCYIVIRTHRNHGQDLHQDVQTDFCKNTPIENQTCVVSKPKSIQNSVLRNGNN